jgi:hypothetical protein
MRASRTQSVLPSAPGTGVPDALRRMATKALTGTTGNDQASARPCTAAMAVRTPVNAPGPLSTAKADNSAGLRPLAASTSPTRSSKTAECLRFCVSARADTCPLAETATESVSVLEAIASTFMLASVVSACRSGCAARPPRSAARRAGLIGAVAAAHVPDLLAQLGTLFSAQTTWPDGRTGCGRCARLRRSGWHRCRLLRLLGRCLSDIAARTGQLPGLGCLRYRPLRHELRCALACERRQLNERQCHYTENHSRFHNFTLIQTCATSHRICGANYSACIPRRMPSPG